MRDLGLIPGLGRFPEEGKGYSLQYSGLENSMHCIVHGVTKSQTQLSNFHFSPILIGSTSWGFPGSIVGKECACNVGYPGLIPGLGESSGKGTGYPL